MCYLTINLGMLLYVAFLDRKDINESKLIMVEM